MDGVDIEDLTIEQYLELTQENHAPSVGPRQAQDDALRNWEAQINQLRRQEHEGSNNKAIILGRPFLANIHAEIYVSTREVSLGIEEDRVKIKMNKQECNFTTPVSEHLDERPTSQDELSYGVGVNNLALRDATKNSKCDSRQQGRVVVVDGVGGTRTVADGMEKIEGVTLEESRRKEE
ncbi:hypothetical protein Tco_1501525 [Tanacetum coccineum]